uniref:Mating-type protein MAT-1 n=3 Tax=Phyllosticta citriasiana TaxID=595635 RepID=A0A866WLR8_9PEZI|nr:alpha box protein [Phyllosticta citriasiana]
MAVAANLPPHVKSYLAACSQAQINQLVSSLKGVEGKRTVAAVVAAGDPTTRDSHSTLSSSKSTSTQATTSSGSRSPYMTPAFSTKQTSSSAQAKTLPTSQPDQTSADMANIQHVAPDISSSQTPSQTGATQASPLRALNSFMAFRVYYNPIFHSFEQKERSGFMKTMWAEEETKAKWSIIAKAWSIIRDEVGKDSAPLDRFLELACPHIDILARDAYLSTLGWELSTDNGTTSLRRRFLPNFMDFPASFRTTTKSVQDVIDFVRSSGYGLPTNDTPPASSNTSTSHLTMAAQPVHHSTATTGPGFLPSSIFHSTNSSSNAKSQSLAASNFGGPHASNFPESATSSTTQTTSMATSATLSHAGDNASASIEQSARENTMDLGSSSQHGTNPSSAVSQQQASNATHAPPPQTSSINAASGPTSGSNMAAQSNDQALMAIIHQHAAAANAGNGGLLTGGPMTHQQMLTYMYGANVQPVHPDMYSPHVDDTIANPDPQSCVMQRASLADPDLLAISINADYPHEILNYYPASTRNSGESMASSVVRPARDEDTQTAWLDCALQVMDTSPSSSPTFPYAEFFNPDHEGLNIFDIDGIPDFTAVDNTDFQFQEMSLPLVTSHWGDESDGPEQ